MRRNKLKMDAFLVVLYNVGRKSPTKSYKLRWFTPKVRYNVNGRDLKRYEEALIIWQDLLKGYPDISDYIYAFEKKLLTEGFIECTRGGHLHYQITEKGEEHILSGGYKKMESQKRFDVVYKKAKMVGAIVGAMVGLVSVFYTLFQTVIK